jgi:predicted nucleic acid-binding protein
VRRFVDTTVLLGAFLEDNPHHNACLKLLRTLTPEADGCGAHSLAEFYSVLTRMPLPLRLSPEQSGILLREVQQRLQAIALTAEEYMQTMNLAVENRVPGGQIYDALLLRCARKFEADRVYTLNLRHFRGLAPDLAERIVTPEV